VRGNRHFAVRSKNGCGANVLRSSQAGAGKLRWITQREPHSERTIGQPSAPGGNGYSAGAADPTGKTKPGLRSLAPSLLGSSEGRRHRA
jgi:hypothetical protein